MSDQKLLVLPGLSPGLSASRMLAQLRQASPGLASVDGVELLDLIERTAAAGRSGADGLAETVADVLEERGAHRVTLIAESVGATAALRLAALRPGLVAHLVLCAPFGYARPLSGTWHPRSSAGTVVRDLYLGDKGRSRAALEVLSGGADLVPEGLLDEYHRAQDDAVFKAATTLADWIENGSLTPMESSKGDRVRQTKVPVSLVWGRDDTVAGVDSAFYLSRRLKDVQLRIFNKLGHLVFAQGGARIAGHVASVLAQVAAEDSAGEVTAPAEKIRSGA
ncbi:alpha/beta hydrolase [Nocardia sp. NPDC050799]|uniref:alpha/beta hydrolase n=1 Tax=Nocardia sp. NPDC050799 TaxID=3154842 RepID=UPI0033DCBB91